ncbi:MAG: aminotransferase class V-fold PLP-dependent enzyme [Bacteroidota bacterium]
MDQRHTGGDLTNRTAPLEMSPEEFRKLGHDAVDRIAEFLASLPGRPVTPAEPPDLVRELLGGGGLPMTGADPGRLLEETASLLFNHSLFNGHPRFWGYITSSAAPIGCLADLLASAVNPNVGGWWIAPIASEIEAQTIRWLAELIGYPTAAGGLLVSGGNMANLVGFWAARKAKTPWDVHSEGISAHPERRLRVYTSQETHTWIQKAADLAGLGTDAVRWIATDHKLRMDPELLRAQIDEDRQNGDHPMLVIGTAGSVSTGAIDPLPELAALCREQEIWFHVDGAYGAAAAALPDAPPDLKGLSEADSVAMDPHKWLYAPLEAGCVLVRDPSLLRETFSYHPPYYPEKDREREEPPIMYFEHGPQNSRGFRALKVWLGLRQVGREGYVRMISDDILLTRVLYRLVESDPDLEAWTQSLSIATFRYVPGDLRTRTKEAGEYLDTLNREVLTRLQNGGRAYVSHAVIDGTFVLRSCIVNFRTTLKDVQALPGIVTVLGKEIDAASRPATLRPGPASPP